MPLCQVFDVGCVVSLPLRRPLQQELFQLVFLRRAEGSRTYALHGRTCEEKALPSDVLQVKSAEAVTWIPAGSPCISLALISRCQDLCWDFRQKQVQLLQYPSNTYKVSVEWMAENGNKQQLLMCFYRKQRFLVNTAVNQSLTPPLPSCPT